MARQTVVWSPEALEDVEAIAAYIARDSSFYAAAVVEKMLAAASGLSTFPGVGRIVPELGQTDVRECFVYSYRLIYQIEETRIVVIAVVHGKRLLDDKALSSRSAKLR
ncbi:MAG: type II toxin-antitoxin system RelE/ParE family toxin [Gammaproteobacteria bacterium]|nr:type II toxin-antitoxin system RelE/ParE family toxin [Gammaproteobacteria bacterium]MBU1775602.1 type II toxin-antitoxin system RelE/ParE family toxin [Gammaproteobacteria bacterium]MBU1967728.1 type II toxin-antitoxin system RelE/ParE family toxin [Gammaproteobacteria bacterium]